MDGNISRKTAFSFILSFIKPYFGGFIPGIILYSSQNFVFPLITAYLLNGVTAKIMLVDAAGLISTGIITFLLMVGVGITTGIGVYLYCQAYTKADRNLKKQLFRVFLRKGHESQISSHSGEGIAALNTDATVASNLYSNSLARLLFCIIPIVFASLVVFLVDYRMGFLSLLIGLLSLYIQKKFAKPLGEIGRERLENNSESVKRMSDIFSGGQIIRAFSLQNKMLISFDKNNKELLKLSYKEAVIGMLQDLFTTVQGLLSISGVFAVGGLLVSTGELTLPQLMMTTPMCASLSIGMSSLGGAWASMQAPLEAGKRLYKLMGGRNKIEPITETATADWNGDCTLTLRDFGFSYQNADTPTLSDINLTINKNEMVAFVGESGSGKSTLLRAAAGLFEREDLGIYLGNIQLRDTELLSWRKHFAYVDQSCNLFDMSIGDNIALGKENADRDEITAAAKEAYADGFITALEDGYNSPAGEKGLSLSGGQKQRIAISRALVRKAPILIFDEATSALDMESERQVMETIQHLRKTHTILIATHNLKSIANADKIVVLDGGRAAEVGTHDELVSRDGIYKRLLGAE
ncbi:MAG: ABC transporter ATP-binding protein/permease [Oscillospiraceae bacterium]|nr:ABC transporter ATP-binding protein/permease [Oscillospiraceae bacterium]